MMLVLRRVTLAHDKVYDRGAIIPGDTSHLGMLERREETITIDTLVATVTRMVIESMKDQMKKAA